MIFWKTTSPKYLEYSYIMGRNYLPNRIHPTIYGCTIDGQGLQYSDNSIYLNHFYPKSY
jgi:hypothetical protein